MDTHTFENNRWSGWRQSLEFRHRAALELVSVESVIDVGCGDGLFLEAMREKGITHVSGADLSEVAATLCREKGFEILVGDFASEPLPIGDRTVDCSISLDTLEHLYNPEPLTRELVRVAKRHVIIGVPNFSSLPARLQVLFGKVPENNRPRKGHVYWFNWAVLNHLIYRNGLELIDARFNAPWERVPFIGQVTHFLARKMPNLFALSFVVLCEKIEQGS